MRLAEQLANDVWWVLCCELQNANFAVGRITCRLSQLEGEPLLTGMCGMSASALEAPGAEGEGGRGGWRVLCYRLAAHRP